MESSESEMSDEDLAQDEFDEEDLENFTNDEDGVEFRYKKKNAAFSDENGNWLKPKNKQSEEGSDEEGEDDEDEDEEDDEKLDIEVKAKKAAEKRARIEAESAAELQMNINLPDYEDSGLVSLPSGGAISKSSNEFNSIENTALMPVDLESLKERIANTIDVLNDFKSQREEGKSRKE
jgi:hypothetical protein